MASARLVGGLVCAVLAQGALSALRIARGVADRMAIHWGPSGEADGFAPPQVALAFSPSLTLLVGILLVAAPRLDPRVRADPETSRAYDRIVMGVFVFFTALHAMVAFQLEVGRILPVGVGVGAVLLGRSLRAIRPNGVMGFRTPWTLASDRAWERTHVAMATAWTWGGALAAVVSLVHPALGLGVLLVTLLGSAVVLAFGSRRWWQDDPDRRSV